MTISSILGVHMNFCSVQLSLYYGHEKCLSCLSTITSSSGRLTEFIPLAVDKLNSSVYTSEYPELLPINEFYKARATSFILLLGVGSYLCYKFCLQLRRKFNKRNSEQSGTSSPGSKKSSPYSNSIANRSSSSLDSTCERLIADDDDCFDPENIELRYFGPQSPNNEGTLSVISDLSEDASFPSSLVSYSDSEYGLDSNRTSTVKKSMGNFNSRFNEPVFYNVDTGIHFRELPDQRTRRIAEQLQNVLSPSRSKRLTATLNRIASKQAAPSAPQRPNHLPVQNLYTRSGEVASGQRMKPELSGLSHSSNYDSSAFPSEMESLSGSWSCDDQPSSHNGSLKGNFSPASLRQKTFRLTSEDASPDRSGSPTSRFYNRNNSIDSFLDAGSEYSVHSSGIRTSGGESMSMASIVREISIDSIMSDDASDLSSLEPLPESIAIETFVSFQELEGEVNELKGALLELDSELLSIQTLKPSPLYCVYSMGDTFDAPDSSSNTSSLSEKSAVAFVQRHKDRLTSRGLLSSNSGSVDDRRQVSSASPNATSTFTSQSSDCMSFSDSDRSSSRQRGISLPLTPLSAVDDTDSGSDFGQSLTSDSPRRNPTPITKRKLQRSPRLSADPYANDNLNEESTSDNNDVNAKCTLRTSIVSSESGFLDGMVTSTASPSEDVIDSSSNISTCKSESKERNMPMFSVGCLKGIQAVPDVNSYFSDLSKHISPEILEKLKEIKLPSPNLSISAQASCSLFRFPADNSGLFRAVVLQALCLRCQTENDIVVPFTSLQGKIEESLETHKWLRKWVFLHDSGNRNPSDFTRKVEDCLNVFHHIKSSISNDAVATNDQSKISLLAKLFDDRLMELKVLDVIKLMMMMSAIRLYNDVVMHSETAMGEGPLFPFLLFTQKNTNNPKNFYKNQLMNLVANCPPSELDLYLLSYTLGVTTRILNVSTKCVEDSSTTDAKASFKYYPDCNIATTLEITLISDEKGYTCYSS